MSMMALHWDHDVPGPPHHCSTPCCHLQVYFDVCNAMGQESTPTISQIPEFLSLLMAASNAVAGDSGTVAQFKVDLAASLKTVSAVL